MYPITTTEFAAKSLAEINAANRRRELAEQARAKLEAASPALINAIRCGTTSLELQNLLASIWGGQLCVQLTSLDSDVAEAVVAMIAARAFLGDDADYLFLEIMTETDSSPPAVW